MSNLKLNQPPKLITLLEKLIAIPSVSSVNPQWDQSNLPVIELLSGWFKDLGFNVEVFKIPGYPGKYNMVATAGKGPDGLVLSGHTDTVPFDEGLWSRSPFRLTEKNQRLYGLGSCDMKSFFAFIIEAVRHLDLAKLKQPLIIVATADEESSMCGAKALVQKYQRLGKYTIIGEPTGLKPVRMHKGIMMEAIRLTGHSGHSSNPALGNSALEGMYEVIGEIIRWRNHLQHQYQNPAFEIDVPTLNLGHIHGGDNPNRICADCELHIDLRPLPGMQLDMLRDELSTRLQHRLAGSNLKLEISPLFEGIPAMETPAESTIVNAAEAMTGFQAEAVAFGTEGPYFKAMNMETLIMGPGSIDQAHQPDEFLALEQIKPGVKLLQTMIHRFCH